MEIVKKKIRMSRQRSQAMNQITLEEDLNVPDSKADVTGIIQHRAKVRVEESKIMENQILVSGNLEVWMLCLAEGEQHPVYRLQAKLPFSEKLNLEGAKPGDNVSLKWKTEDIRISLIFLELIRLIRISSVFHFRLTLSPGFAPSRFSFSENGSFA